MFSPAEEAASNDQPEPGEKAVEKAVKVTDLCFPRRRKQLLLPEIRDLALEGHTCREIGERLGLAKTTVHHWLQELRRERADKAADGAEMTATAIARYDAIYREAMQAWRRFEGGQVRPARPGYRAQPQQRPRFATEMLDPHRSAFGRCRLSGPGPGAVDAICKLMGRDARPAGRIAEPRGERIRVDMATDDDLHSMTHEQVALLEAQLQARNVACRPRGGELCHADKPGPNGTSGDNGLANWNGNGTK